MRILGVDPGTATTGIGIIEGERNSGFKSISYTCIKTDSKLPIEERLKLIYDSLDAIIKESKPDLISVEELFFNSNPKTAMSVGRACGAIILCASHNNLKVVEHTPLEVKSAVVGFELDGPNQQFPQAAQWWAGQGVEQTH